MMSDKNKPAPNPEGDEQKSGWSTQPDNDAAMTAPDKGAQPQAGEIDIPAGEDMPIDLDKAADDFLAQAGLYADNGEVEKLRTENAELKSSVLRVMADMENLRKRTEREKTQTAKFAISDFARDILSIGDNLARAVEAVPGDAIETDPALKSLVEGVEMTDRQMVKVLERHGVKRVDPMGTRFDPNLHQAMFKMPDQNVEEGTIVQVAQVGYMIDERVLRPAMVGISEGGPKPEKSAATTQTEPAAQPDPDTPPQPADQTATESPQTPPASGQPDNAPPLGGRIDKNV